MNESVLIVDDETSIRFAFAKALEKEGYQVCEADNGQTAVTLIEEEAPDVILLDMKLPDMSGLEVLKASRQSNSNPIVIMMTAYGDIELAVEAMQLGADNFRSKPFNVEEMKDCIKKAILNRKNKVELESYRQTERQRYSFQNIVGDSPAMKKVYEMISKVAVSPSTTVLIQGPSGTGKELVAKAIHFKSSRCDNRFIEVNCTAIPESLLESELFGHEKGSFTDAKKEHKGIFEQADGGTLFLDEIGDMPLAMQAKLLRALQEKRFKRVGGNRDISVNVRVIASTNIALEEAVKAGKFREDLFYRLKVVPITLPALRDRCQDALLIARHYLMIFSNEFKKQFRGFTVPAESAICSYSWPGNVRELKNVIERAVLLENGEYLDVRHLNLDGFEPAETVSFSSEMDKPVEGVPIPELVLNHPEPDGGIELRVNSFNIEEVEKKLLDMALRVHNWNKNEVANVVGINRTTLYSKIKKYGLEENP
ncbi:MAG: sigma-54-dependent Fis family transcriptional regulator [Candidatus Aureabacteria bacterium]|nr:sigma-54-dependent Fis family transcriptional regulator [Candidatus Auribacterota bacterium]